MTNKQAEIAKAGGATVAGGVVGGTAVVISGLSAAGAMGSGAGIGMSAGPLGVIAGGILGLAGYGIYRLVGSIKEEK